MEKQLLKVTLVLIEKRVEANLDAELPGRLMCITSAGNARPLLYIAKARVKLSANRVHYIGVLNENAELHSKNIQNSIK